MALSSVLSVNMGFRVNVGIATLFVSASLLLLNVAGQALDVQKMYTMCKEKSNATEEELSAFQKSQSIPSTPRGKCLLECIFSETGVMTKDGKYNAEGMYNLAKQSYSSKPEKLVKAKQVIDICSQEVKNVQDKCDVAVMLANCTMVASVKLGLESG